MQKTEIKNLDLIGSNVNLSGLEVETANDKNRAFILNQILKDNSTLVNRYDNISYRLSTFIKSADNNGFSIC